MNYQMDVEEAMEGHNLIKYLSTATLAAVMSNSSPPPPCRYIVKKGNVTTRPLPQYMVLEEVKRNLYSLIYIYQQVPWHVFETEKSHLRRFFVFGFVLIKASCKQCLKM